MVTTRRNPRPFDRKRLEEAALAYVARFATTRGKLETYLARKVTERGWDDEGPVPISEISEKFVLAGYIDDETYARAKAGSLLRKGYGRRRVDQALGHDGISEDIRHTVQFSERDVREAVLKLARKRRFGPFGAEFSEQGLDRSVREKQIAAMLRGGHSMDHTLAVIDAPSLEEAEQWADCEGYDTDD